MIVRCRRTLLLAIALLAQLACKREGDPSSSPKAEAAKAEAQDPSKKSAAGEPHHEDLTDYRKTFFGAWKGDGMELTITSSGRVKYKRKKGMINKSFTAKITDFKKSSFEVGFMGISTTFEIDQPPHRQGGKWKMTIDGVELTRVRGVRLGAALCTRLERGDCARARDTFSPQDKIIRVVYRTPKMLKPGLPFSVAWIAEDVGKAAPPNYKIAVTKGNVAKKEVKKANYFTVRGRLKQGRKPWPKGDYRVEIRLGGKLVSTTPFKVAAPSAPPAAGPANPSH